MVNKNFLEILNIQSVSGDTEAMVEYLFDKCLERGYEVEYSDGNLYVIKGISPDNNYPCIISHTDTVHDIIPQKDYMVIHDDNVIMAYDLNKMSLTGIGGDDKVGIYICMEMLDRLEYCKAAFFRDEEIGCHGSMLANMEFFKDVRFVLQCDRKGNKDFVYNIFGTDLYGEDFFNSVSPILDAYGYSESTGGLTDVYQLAENGVGVAVANMSCGYYNPHMDDEMINIDDVENCLNMVQCIMTNCTDVYEHKIVKKEYKYFNPSKNKYDYNSTFNGFTEYYTPKETNMNDDKWDGWSYDGKKYSKSYSEEVGECWHCGTETLESSLTKDGLCSYCKTYHQDCSVPF
jgi:hypothetical protein